MKIYLAHNFAAADMLRDVVNKIKAIGSEVTSRWIFYVPNDEPKAHYEEARMDLEDIDKADCLVLFTDQVGDTPGRGKYIEFGYALGKGKKVIIVGEAFNSVFYYLKHVIPLSTTDDLIAFLIANEDLMVQRR